MPTSKLTYSFIHVCLELKELLGGSPVIEETETEVEWVMVQAEPTCKEDGSPLNEEPENRLELKNELAESNKSVVRKFEFYKYTGPYDPENNKAKPEKDDRPLATEIGNYIGSQMVAVNLARAAAFPCFLGGNMVEIDGKGHVAMKDLKIGDMVRVGPDRFDRVYSFGHYNKNVTIEYLRFHLSDDHHQQAALEITGLHMIFLKNAANAIPASSIKVGDTLIAATVDDDVDSMVVSKIDTIVCHGAFAPFTYSGKVGVNGIVASSYVTLLPTEKDVGGLFVLVGQEQRDSSTWISMHWLAHTFQAPHRVICRLYWEFCRNETYTTRGLSRWVDGPLTASLLVLDQSPMVVELFLILPLLMVALAFAAVERLILLLDPAATAILLLLLVMVALPSVVVLRYYHLARHSQTKKREVTQQQQLHHQRLKRKIS